MAPEQLQQLPQSPPPPEDQARLLITTDDKVAEDQESQNEKHYSEQTVVPESEDEEADKQTMRTPCVRKPTPAKKTTTTKREPPHPHCSSYYDRGIHSDTHLGSPTTASGFVIEPLASEPVDVVPPQPEKPPLVNAASCRSLKRMPTRRRIKRRPRWLRRRSPVSVRLTGCGARRMSVDASRNQFLDKIRRLKRKYSSNNVEKGEKAVFSRPHEHKCFELSNKIWGDGGRKVDTGVDGNGKIVSTRARKTQENRKEVALGEKAMELEKKWQICADEVLYI
ncbi:hypothetical protein C3L33_21753, partial [Rhododendron williamsianum]